jgi:tripartite-type tricarboxylate transporter receptor subunit TctC
MENATARLIAGYEFNTPELKDKASSFIANNYKKVMETPDWTKFIKENPAGYAELNNEIMKKMNF